MNVGRNILWLLLALEACRPGHAEPAVAGPAPLPPAASREVGFARDIKPIFDASCIKCHGRGRSKGGFRLDTRETVLQGGDSGPALKPGESSSSLIVKLVAGVDPENVMPQKGSRLTSEQIGLLRAWIDQGAKWDAAITFSRPAPINLAPPAPKIQVSEESGVNPIDQILKSYFAAHHFQPPATVSVARFARRVYLDAIGLLPPSDVFGAADSDRATGSRSQLVAKVLSDNERYAEHWLSFWNDLLRNDYRGTGYIDGGREQITSWVYEALSTNLPYDQFVAQLVDPVPATKGFTKGIVWRGVVNASQSPEMQAAQNISQVFMGVNLKCASCHDSFVNDWRLSDSYGLAAVYSTHPLEMFRCDKPTGQTAAPAFIYPELGMIDPGADKAARLRRLAEIITGPQDGRLSRTIVNRLWARFFGRGLVEPVDDMERPAWDQDLLDWLAADLVAHHYDLKHTIGIILTSKAYQLPSVALPEAASKNFMFQGPGVRRLTAEQFRDALGQLTGVWFSKAALPTPAKEIRCSLVPADPLTTALGRPCRDQVITSRATIATTLQALELTNGETLASILKLAGERLAANASTADDVVQRVYRQALGRSPTPVEARLSLDLIGTPPEPNQLEDLLWAMAMLPEFQLIF